MTRWLLAAVSVVGCTEPPRPPPPTSHLRADVTLRDVTVRQYRGSELRVVARSPTLELMRGSNDFSAYDAGVFLKHTGVTVLAQRIDGNGVAQVATGSRGVTFVGNDGMIGHTPTATFERALGTEGGAYSDAGVHVDHPRFALDATGFTVDLAEQRAIFDAPVTKTKEAR